MKTTVTCIIPSTCSEKVLSHLKNCIKFLKNSARNAKIQIKIVVVKDSREVKNPSKKRIDLFLYAGEKPGFAKMNNFALDKSLGLFNSDYHLLINDDAWIEENFFEEFIRAKKDSPDFIIPKIYSGDTKELDSFGVEYFKSGYAKNSVSSKVETTLASAACLLVKSSFFKKMKAVYGFYFNEILSWYLEDVEFSIRARVLGATVKKEPKMKAHHIGSFTAMKKSYFTIFQTYRNVVWLIILTWPAKVILKKVFPIFVVQGWMLIYSTIKFGPMLYLRVVKETVQNLRKLLTLRRSILAAYTENFKFDSLFSRYMFRTGRGIPL